MRHCARRAGREGVTTSTLCGRLQREACGQRAGRWAANRLPRFPSPSWHCTALTPLRSLLTAPAGSMKRAISEVRSLHPDCRCYWGPVNEECVSPEPPCWLQVGLTVRLSGRWAVKRAVGAAEAHLQVAGPCCGKQLHRRPDSGGHRSVATPMSAGDRMHGIGQWSEKMPPPSA